jgi:hypothetical protein
LGNGTCRSKPSGTRCDSFFLNYLDAWTAQKEKTVV